MPESCFGIQIGLFVLVYSSWLRIMMNSDTNSLTEFESNKNNTNRHPNDHSIYHWTTNQEQKFNFQICWVYRRCYKFRRWPVRLVLANWMDTGGLNIVHRTTLFGMMLQFAKVNTTSAILSRLFKLRGRTSKRACKQCSILLKTTEFADNCSDYD